MSLATPVSSRVLPMFCSNAFRVPCFTVIFMSDDMCLIYFLSLWTFSFPKTIYWRYLLQSVSLASLSNIKWLYFGYICLGLFFCFIGLQSIFMPPFYYFSVYITMALEIWTGNPISLAIQGLLWFQMKFWGVFFVLFLWRMRWEFWMEVHRACKQ